MLKSGFKRMINHEIDQLAPDATFANHLQNLRQRLQNLEERIKESEDEKKTPIQQAAEEGFPGGVRPKDEL